MKTKRLNLFIAVVLVASMLCSMQGCASGITGVNLMEGFTAEKVEAIEDLGEGNVVVSDFAMRLFKEGIKEGENTLLSPLSVLCAIAMTANGAEAETLRQMEAVLGMPVDELNLYVHGYMKSLPTSEKYKLSLANSIWFTEDGRFKVNENFLQTNANYFGADIYKAPFDNTTLKDINNWVRNKTEGMIPEILDKIPQDAVMYLVNALAFEAEWSDIYLKTQVKDGVFTLEDKTKKNVKFMHSTEGSYIEDENATGFIKYYKDYKYAFVALLPKEGVSVSEYVESLTGERLANMLANPINAEVYAAIPKFETEYSVEMSDILRSMGMTDAFDEELAAFTSLGTSSAGNIFINRVLHKTFISVEEKGTKAGAATVVEMTDGAALVTDTKTVKLDRPFVYMLIDCENKIPFFVGTMLEP